MKMFIAIAFLVIFSGVSPSAAQTPAWILAGIRPVMNAFPPCYSMTCASRSVKFRDSVARRIPLAVCHKRGA